MGLFKKRVKRDENGAPIRDHLKYAFTDPNGKKGKRYYYQFESLDKLPIERYAKSHELLIEITRGVTKESLLELLEIAETAIHKGLINPKEAAKVTAVITEIRLRNGQIMPVEVYYGYLAACYVREDENPMKWNHQAHLEKVEAFKGAVSDYNSFFFALPEYKKLCELFNISTNDWQTVIHVSENQQARNQKANAILK